MYAWKITKVYSESEDGTISQIPEKPIVDWVLPISKIVGDRIICTDHSLIAVIFEWVEENLPQTKFRLYDADMNLNAEGIFYGDASSSWSWEPLDTYGREEGGSITIKYLNNGVWEEN